MNFQDAQQLGRVRPVGLPIVLAVLVGLVKSGQRACGASPVAVAVAAGN